MSRGDFGGRSGHSSDAVRGSTYGVASHGGRSRPSGRDGDSEYIRMNNKVSANVTQISTNVASIERLTNEMGGSRDGPELRIKLGNIQKSTAELAKETAECLKQLGRLDGGSNAETQRKLQQKRLMDSFSQVLSKFKAVEKRVAEKQRVYVEKAKRTASFSHEDDDGGETTALMSRENEREMFQMQEEVDIELIREREDAILQIETTMGDVNQIFKDLSLMVHEQGDMIDNIECNVEDAHDRVEEGNKQLVQARKHQKSSRKKMCCCLTILIIGAIVLTLVIVLPIVT
ncbi:syntaxin-12-like isoform X2 [Corticium candelabrum]|uniref:syntaxin-12-like isoform X2 n=1 Tax=Corticium candelabrum TaxID=121492 RepID=UPI002E26CB47|nr:syntaxin-12-like isoform X2 [Corticium candelabrum]